MRFPDLSEYKNLSDIPLLLSAILLVDVVVMFFTRLYPSIFGLPLNNWYTKFGLSAVISDVFIILIGFIIGKYIYTNYLKDTYGYNPLLFIGLVVLVQFIHDVLFYIGPILKIPRGSNEMMDVFKAYAESGGAKILGGDALLMIFSFLVASLYKQMSPQTVMVSSVVTVYMLPYILYMKPVY